MRGALVFAVIGMAFVDTLAQLPLIAPYAESLGGSPLGVGAAVGMYSLANMVANVVLGPLVDRWGRRPSMTVGLGIAALALVLYPHAGSIQVLVGLRGLHGLGGGLLVPAAFAYAADRTGPTHRGLAMSKVGIAIGVAALLGPAAGGALAGPLGHEGVFRLLAVLMSLTALFVASLLPSYGPAPSRLRLGDLGRYWELLESGSFRGALTAVSGLTFAKGVLAMAFPLRAEALGYSSGQVGGLLSVFAGAAVVTFALGRRIANWSPTWRMVGGLLVGAAAVAGLNVVRGAVGMAALLAVFGVGFGLVFASSAAQVAVLFPANRGRGFALYHAWFSFGFLTGPLAAGALSLLVGVPPLAIGAAVMAVAGAVVSLQLGGGRNGSM